jgi:DNA topoisomerase-1
MGKILVFVESPAKIHTLGKILGPNYEVMASVGHIINIKKGSIADSIDIKNDFEPIYEVSTEKAVNVANLKKAVKTASDIYIASDLDREGEMIAWSLAYILKLKNPKRIVFNSITKSSIEKAMANPLSINQAMVDAQKTRSVLDKLVGYELSPVLWRTIAGALSAGRVQSVVVKILVDREKEIKQFFNKDAESYFKFNGIFNTDKNIRLSASLYQSKKSEVNDDIEDDLKEDDNVCDASEEETPFGVRAKVKSEKTSRDLMNLLIKSTYKVTDVSEKQSMRYPSPPFTTSTLQQEAAGKLGFTIEKTMRVAQHLYEAGYITYMRTDSVNLSSEALEDIGKYVIKSHGKQYHRQTNYESHGENTQEAHEAIRPSDVNILAVKQEGKLGPDEHRLYNLIWKRTVASQMSGAKFLNTDIKITISKTNDYYFMTQLEKNIFPGFLVVYNLKSVENEDEDENDDDKIVIPKKNDIVLAVNIEGRQDYQKPPSRYNEAILVKKLSPKNLGIGRPATTVSVVSKIQNIGYVKKEDVDGVKLNVLTLKWSSNGKLEEEKSQTLLGKEKNRLVPTQLGITVTDFLSANFPEIMDYKFTAKMETTLDNIAKGKAIRHKVLREFYEKLHPLVETLMSKDNKVEIKDDNARVLGSHPETGEDVIATIAKYGPIVKMASGKKMLYGPIKAPLKRETITLDQALDLFKFPKILGKYEKKNIVLKDGKNGLYATWGDDNISLENTKCEIKENITLEEVIELIEEKQKDILWDKKDGKIQYSILKGPHGPYIKVKDTSKKTAVIKNVSIPKHIDLEEEIDLEKVKEIVAAKKKTNFSKTSFANKKTTVGGKKTVKVPGKTRKPKVNMFKIEK